MLEYLYLLIEIIKSIHSNISKHPVKKEELYNIFEYVRSICRSFYYSFNYEFTKFIKDSLNHLKKCNIYPNYFIDDLIMELRLNTNPNITGNINDRKSLSNLVKNNILKIDYEMINFNKDIDDLKRTDNNKNRMNLIKCHNDMIQKQIKLYNENLKQIKCLNELINKCDNLNL